MESKRKNHNCLQVNKINGYFLEMPDISHKLTCSSLNSPHHSSANYIVLRYFSTFFQCHLLSRSRTEYCIHSVKNLLTPSCGICLFYLEFQEQRTCRLFALISRQTRDKHSNILTVTCGVSRYSIEKMLKTQASILSPENYLTTSCGFC